MGGIRNARSTISKIELGTNDVPTSKLKIIAENLVYQFVIQWIVQIFKNSLESVELVNKFWRWRKPNFQDFFIY